MENKSWESLESKGWIKRRHQVTGRISFKRPGLKGKIVNAKRDLTDVERVEIGDILFPGRVSLPGDSGTDVLGVSAAQTSDSVDSGQGPSRLSGCDTGTSEVYQPYTVYTDTLTHK